MNNRQLFKVTFLQKCAEEGLNREEILERIEDAQYAVTKEAWIKDLVSAAGSVGLPLVGLASTVIPGAAGFGAGALGSMLTDPGTEDTKDIKNKELTDEYRRMTEQLQLAAQAAKLRHQFSRSGRPLI